MFDSSDIWSIATAGDLIVVLQPDEFRVSALDAGTGELRWRVGREGGGPAEFGFPRRLLFPVGGGVGVLDDQRARIALLDAHGRVRGARAPSTPLRGMDDACVDRDRMVLARGLPKPGTLALLDSAGEPVRTLDVVWPDTVYTPIAQTWFARRESDGLPCIMYGPYAPWFAVLDRVLQPAAGPFPLIDRATPPRRDVDARGWNVWTPSLRDVAIDAVVDDSLLWILSLADTASAPWIDAYAWRTGRYAGSIATPRGTRRFSRIDGDVVLQIRQDGVDRVERRAVRFIREDGAGR